MNVKFKRPQQKTRREKRRFRRRMIVIAASIIAIFTSFFYVMNHSYLRLHDVDIKGQKTLIATDVEVVVEEYLSRRFMWIFPRNNIFIFNSGQLENILSEQFPKINDIQVSVHDAKTVVVELGERSAHSLWCIDQEYESVFDEECYFADQSGLLYARAPYFSGNVYLKLFIQPIEEGGYIGMTMQETVTDFEELFTFLDATESELPLHIESVYFDDFGDVRLVVDRLNNIIYDEVPIVVSYNEQDSYEIILRNIGITLDVPEFKQAFKERAQDLESIDVRFDGRIFYTFTLLEIESE